MSNELIPRIDTELARRAKDMGKELTFFMTSANDVFEQAKRADLNSEEDFGSAGDLVKVIRALDTSATDTRKEWTLPFRNITQLINGAFGPPQETLRDAKSAIESKMRAWRADVERKLQKEAVERRRKLEEEALERAAAAGDEEEQDAVLEVAAMASEELSDRVALGPVRGALGASVGKRKTYTGNVDNLEQFVMSLSRWNALALPEDVIVIKQGALNKLAKKVHEKKITIPGFSVTENSNLNIR